MNDVYKGIVGFIILFLLVCTGCFFAGYFLHNKRATDQLNEANRQIEAQQRRYDDLIRETKERIRQSEERVREANERVANIREELLGKVSANGEAERELSAIIEQVKRQRIDL